jgi:hypothetical protein
MTVKQHAAKAALAAAGLVLAAGLATGLTARPAAARVFVHLGIGVPAYPYYGYAPYYYGYPPPPIVYAPPPVVYSPPPPVVVVPPAPTYVQQPEQSWYYCDNPKGYYPYVQDCRSGWHQVPARPPEK